ncbi:ATP-dependent helicase [Scatolibacter rhodanostii]|uniref:ATP-dependent helicase n=1 Tax=Scatolibacter rhodanostii TaxID=2014781 RepID=UPI000C077B12|nr:UvrD-helicase domain-containing protein [Scatolibacter rhodanostii]
MIHTDKEKLLELRKKVIEKDFNRMNDRQKEAVFTTEGPVLVLAGAGSGKTTVLVNRIANIVRYGKAYHSSFIQDSLTEEDVEACQSFLNGGELSDVTRARLSVSACFPWKVMAITFTNKAAAELKERLCNMLGGEDGEQIWASTFHSSCARMLRRDGDRLGYSSHFTIYDSDDSRRMMKESLKELDVSEKALTPKAVLGEISRAKDELLSPAEFEKEAGDDFRLKLIAKAYKLYQKKLKEADAMDFDDLIVNTVRLFQTAPDVLAYYQDRFRYIMVDEYQDTNHAQYEFINLLAQKSENLCVVGDDDQSIYKFRGATIENIMNFEQDFLGASVIRLEQNYRSTQNILDAANEVIQNNSARKGKNLWTSNGSGEKIKFHVAETEQDEAGRIAKIILDGVANGRKFSDYAVLYRMNSQSLSLERMFAKQGIPHRIIGGTRFFDRKEIKDMIAYLNIVNNPNDEIRMRRVINCPKRGIGDATVDKVFQIAGQLGENFLDVIAHAEDFPILARAAKKLKDFASLLQEWIEILQDDTQNMNDLYRSIVEKTDYVHYLKTDDPERAEDKIENIQELSSNIQRYEEESQGSLAEFLEEISLFTDIDNYDVGTDASVMMTVHSAKGLEFPVVFLPGWEEGVFPGMAVIYNPAEVEEERRLAYVAITRAKEELYIFSAESRMVFGSTNRNKTSRFVEEIPSELKENTRSREAYVRPVTMPSFGGPAQSQASSRYQPLPTPNKVSGQTYHAGDQVEHKTFGVGLILTTTPMANDTLLEIAFDKVGTKKIFANFAKLNIL